MRDRAALNKRTGAGKDKSESRTKFGPAGSSDEMARLQKTLGNRSLLRFMGSGVLQAKRTVGRPDDQYEQEADRTADAVMRMTEPGLQAKHKPKPG